LSVPFSDDQLYLQPLNDFVLRKGGEFQQFLERGESLPNPIIDLLISVKCIVTEVADSETYFGIDEYMDVSTTRKYIIYISRKELTSIHQQLLENVEQLVRVAHSLTKMSLYQLTANKTQAPTPDDPLQQILRDLGTAPEGDVPANEEEISLTLQPKITDVSSNAANKPPLWLFI
jgi:hypothetical protein